jgi:hypothetical protein
VLGLQDKRHYHVEIGVRVGTNLLARRTHAARARLPVLAQKSHSKVNGRRKLPDAALAAKQISMPKRTVPKSIADNALHTVLTGQSIPSQCHL